MLSCKFGMLKLRLVSTGYCPRGAHSQLLLRQGKFMCRNVLRRTRVACSKRMCSRLYFCRGGREIPVSRGSLAVVSTGEMQARRPAGSRGSVPLSSVLPREQCGSLTSAGEAGGWWLLSAKAGERCKFCPCPSPRWCARVRTGRARGSTASLRGKCLGCWWIRGYPCEVRWSTSRGP